MPALIPLALDAPPVEGALLQPPGNTALTAFWVGLALLLVTARLLGAVARRFGQPSVVGELLAGVVLGPSLLGLIAPDVTAWLFPGDPTSSAMLFAAAWLGIALLLTKTGIETDLGILRRLGRSATTVSVGSLVVPIAMGFGLGLLLPDLLYGAAADRLGFALFMAVAMSISALPVVARVLADLGLLRRNVGQVTLAAGMVNDLIGWILLGGVIGIFTAGGFDPGALATTAISVGVFLAAAMTIGQRGVDRLLRQVHRGGQAAGLAATIAVVAAFGAVTQYIGVEAVLGARIAGLVIGRSPYARKDVEHTIDSLSDGVFGPIFFATAGLFLDLTVLGDPAVLTAAIVVTAVAAIGKLLGSYLGARLGGMNNTEGLALGVGLNARGALEIVLATIGLGIGALNESSYAVLVLMAMITSIAAPPLLRPILARLVPDEAEAERLERERLLDNAIVAGARRALVPTRGGGNSATAAHVLHNALTPEATVTVLTVGQSADDRPDASDVLEALEDRDVTHRIHQAADVDDDILDEARLGYDLLALGVSENVTGTHALSPRLQRIVAASPIPTLLVRRGRRDTDLHAPYRSVLVPVTGTRTGRAAEEIAYSMASRSGAEVHAMHVTPPMEPWPLARRGARTLGRVATQLDRTRDLSRRLGVDANVVVRDGDATAQALADAADEHGCDVIVVGTEVRAAGGELFLGHGVERLLDESDQTVVVVLWPAPPIEE